MTTQTATLDPIGKPKPRATGKGEAPPSPDDKPRVELGKPLPNDRRAPLQVLLPKELRRRVRIYAADHEVEISEVVAAALRAHLKDYRVA
jgi:hypothetical protein